MAHHRSNLSFLLALFLGLLGSAAGLAAEPAPPGSDAAPAHAEPGLCMPADSLNAGSAREPQIQSQCTAYCYTTGGSVTVNCPYSSCSAYDQNCPSFQGYAKCNDGSQIQYCGACPQSCYVARECPDGTYIDCTSNSGDCLGGGALCFVRCDGVYTFCPGHEGEIIC
jgi:hypothetical protein